MKKLIFVCLRIAGISGLLLIINITAMAHEKVVIVPLNSTETKKKVLNVKPVFSSSFEGLGTPIYWIDDRIETLSNGSVSIKFDNTSVATDQLLPMVSAGSLESAYGWAGYHSIPAAVLFGGIPFGPEVIEFLAWVWHGNGLTLWQELYDSNGYNVKVLPCGAVTGETGGWYEQPIDSVNDFSGLKMRVCGLGALALQKLGAITTCFSGSEIISKFQDGSIDAAEFSAPAIDSLKDFPSVASYNYFPGWHQPSFILELLVNKDVWNNLTAHQQMAIDMSCRAVTAENMSYSESIQAQYIIDNAMQGVENRYFPDAVLTAIETEMSTVMDEQRAANTDFDKIYTDYLNFHNTYKTWLDLGFNPRR